MDGLGESCGKGYTVILKVTVGARGTGMVTVTATTKGTAVLGEDRTVLVKYVNSLEKKP